MIAIPAPDKTCKGCGQARPIGEFYRNRSMSDGHASRCKLCQLIAARAKYRALPRSARRTATPAPEPTPIQVFARAAKLRTALRRAMGDGRLEIDDPVIHPGYPTRGFLDRDRPAPPTGDALSRVCLRYYRQWDRIKKGASA